ncbi:MAG: phosphomannomutase/phosphoglucomutase [Deltaproteobacteria bacterium]|nr:phosphomannomutase/phosphoglucomutase [Deltaproteobacteria bacterium]MBW2395645.1 phosphomannomutase/phosphoglucomutase [Deltaproteobacteria bacterium]
MSKIFKAYDIRGVFPDELDAGDAYAIGRGTASFFGADTLVIGRDARASSPELVEALIRGVRDEGVAVIDIGLVATPMLYFAVDSLGAGGGIMLTASHNPAEYNGFKICREHAIPVGEVSGLVDIERLSQERKDAAPADRPGELTHQDVLAGYVDHVLAVGQERPALHVAIDCGNGMAGVALGAVLERLSLRTERLYFEPDCTFPNHPADPLQVENLADVVAMVKKTGADFGVAFDGDADRAIFVDDTGSPVSSDLVTALLARSQLLRHPGGRVLYDLRSSWVTPEEIEAAGGSAGICRVGHSFVKAAMREEDAIFAGELSGHFYFRFSPTLFADDGIAALVALLDLLGREGKPFSELVAPLRRYHASGEISRRVADPAAILDDVESKHASASEVSRLDGLLVRYDDWWFNLRPSNTEPLLRLNVEARSQERMETERDRLLEVMV